MIGLARVAERGPLIAAGLAAFLLLLALWLPAAIGVAGSPGLFIVASFLCTFCLVCSAAVVAFVALRHGEMSALQVMGGCLLLLIVVSAILYRSIVQVPMIAAVFWLPAIVAAIVLARSVKLHYSLITIVVCGAIAVLGWATLFGDGTEYWRAQLAIAESIAGEQSGVTLTAEQQQGLVSAMAKIMTGAIGVSVMTVALGALLLARFWQAALFNPGGFQQEFHALCLGRHAALVGVLIIAIAVNIGGQIPVAIAMVVIFAFFIQGLAVVHAVVKQRGMHRYWLHGIYVLLLLPHTLLLLAALGLADNAFSLRRS